MAVKLSALRAVRPLPPGRWPNVKMQPALIYLLFYTVFVNTVRLQQRNNIDWGDNRGLKNVFGTNKEVIREEERKSRSEELHNLFCYCSIAWMIRKVVER
jgi:hypothetical protein